MQVSSVSNTNFQSRVKYTKRMTKTEKNFAKELLDYKFADNKSNRQYLREYGLNLSFDSSPSSLLSPAIRFKPSFYILNEGFDYKRIEPMMGEQKILSSVKDGAENIKNCIHNAYLFKKEHPELNAFSTPWGYIKRLFVF